MVIHDLWEVSYARQKQRWTLNRSRFWVVKLSQVIQKWRSSSPARSRIPIPLRYAKPGRVLNLVLKSRLLVQQGETEVAATLMRQARLIRSDLETLVEEELPGRILWDAVSACVREDIPRVELLRRFETVVRHYPDSSAAPAAREYATLLQRMLREDREGERDVTAQSIALGRELQELAPSLGPAIHRLRDTRLHLVRGAPPPDRLDDLVRGGVTHVPTLLAHLDDQRLTRSQPPRAPHPLDDPRRWVLRYGDVALLAISRIALHPLRTPGEARAWWSEVLERGETAVITERTLQGKIQPTIAITRLLQLDEQRAFELVEQLLPRIRISQSQLLVRLLAQAPGASPVLRRFTTRPKLPLAIRAIAADVLAQRGESGWVDPLWPAIERDESRTRYLLKLLVARGTEHELEKLRRSFSKLGAHSRRTIVEAAARVPRDYSRQAEAAEALLITGLRDTKPAVARAAAQHLSVRWGFGGLSRLRPDQREQRRVELEALWLSNLGRELRPDPRPPIAPLGPAPFPPLRRGPRTSCFNAPVIEQ